jgi:carboxylesterase type B
MNREASLPKTTHVYREADGIKVELDVYGPASSAGLLPVVVWIHGGALIPRPS